MSRRNLVRPVPSSKLRAVVTDVDGTLTDGRRRLDMHAIAALMRLERRGIPVVIATGNVLPVALALHRFLGLSGPIIAENGGLLYEQRNGRETVVRLADRQVGLRALRRLRSVGIKVTPLFTDRWRESEVALEPGVSVDRLRKVLRGEDVTVESTGFATHLMEAGAGKLPALRRGLRRLGLKPRECFIAGDGDNDVPMLREAGWGVSFPNASTAAQAAADYVAHESYGVGFVEALKRARLVAPRRGGFRTHAARAMSAMRGSGSTQVHGLRPDFLPYMS